MVIITIDNTASTIETINARRAGIVLQVYRTRPSAYITLNYVVTQRYQQLDAFAAVTAADSNHNKRDEGFVQSAISLVVGPISGCDSNIDSFHMLKKGRFVDCIIDI